MKKTILLVLVLLVVGLVLTVHVDSETGEWSIAGPWSGINAVAQNEALFGLLSDEDAQNVVGQMETLVGDGAEIDSTNGGGYQPIHLAAFSGHVDAIAWLVRNGVDVATPDADGEQALHAAASSARLEAVELLLEYGANVDATSNRGTQPLHSAAIGGSKEVIAMLLKAGANATATTHSGQTAYGFTSDSAIRDMLVASGAEREAPSLFEATELGEQLSMLWLTSDGLDDLNKQARRLLESGAKPDTVSGEGMQAVHFMTHDAEIMKLLIEKGASPIAADWDGLQPLHIAVENEELDTIRLLLANGADPNAKTRDGMSAHDLAPSEEVRALLKK